MSKIKTKILNIQDGELSIDHSGFSDYWTCPTLYLYKQVHRRESSETSPSALNFGSGIHLCMEEFYKGKSIVECNQVCAQHFVDSPQEVDDFRSSENARRLIEAYGAHYGRERDMEPLSIDGSEAVELPFKVKLGEFQLESSVEGKDRTYRAGEWIIVNWIGKIDLITKDSNGRSMLVDHKTTSRMGGNYFTQFRMSGQFRGYCYAANHLWSEQIGWVDKYMINALQLTYKGNIELARQEFTLTKEMVEEWQRGVMGDIQNLVQMAQSGEWGTNGWKSCAWLYGRACEYCSVCETREDMRGDVLWSPLYRDYSWSPLEEG
jgi:CRISPR/Cas system-associated exonuclease Cas4 (RecB family)